MFYAVKRYLAAAEESGMSLSDAMALVSSRVMGIDLHPVAVALARVTYLLALGRDRLNAPERGSLSVPIYLGDSLGWDQREDLLSVNQLVIPTEVGDQILSGELRFADHLLTNSGTFDSLVQSLLDESRTALLDSAVESAFTRRDGRLPSVPRSCCLLCGRSRWPSVGPAGRWVAGRASGRCGFHAGSIESRLGLPRRANRRC